MSSNAVVVCSWGEGRDGLPAGAEETLTLARRLAASLGAELHWLLLGPLAAGVAAAAGRFGVASLEQIEDAKLVRFAADPFVAALAGYCSQKSPRVVLFSQTPDARLLAPRLAGRLDSAVVMNAVDVATAGDTLEVTASAYGGDTRAVYALAGPGTHVLSLLANAVLPEPLETPAAPPAVSRVAVDLASSDERVRVVQAARSEGPRLEDSEIIVSGGRGLGSRENYKLIEQLAEALGGMAGASRPLVDEGWVDSSHQVGLTGRITRPALYLAAGISGASQHMAGCSAAKTLVAINKDPDAAIFQHARYGIVGDCLQILPELIRAAGQR